MTDFRKKLQTVVDPRLSSTVVSWDLEVITWGLIMCPLFLRRLQQGKILSPVVFSISLGAMYLGMFFHVLYFGIFFWWTVLKEGG